MVKENNKAFTIKFKPSLMEQVEKYIEAVNENKDPYEKKLSKAAFFNNVILDYFEGKVLTNDFITLKEPFYFNAKELIEKKVVKASAELPIHNLDSHYIVKKVPNNLDKWNKKHESYSLDESPSMHKGIYISYTLRGLEHDSYESNIYETVKKISGEFYIITSYYIFKFDAATNELEISLIPFNEIFLYIPSDSDILAKLEKEKEDFYNNILDDTCNINFDLLAKKNDVIESFYKKKVLDKNSKIVGNKFFDSLK